MSEHEVADRQRLVAGEFDLEVGVLVAIDVDLAPAGVPDLS
jgi:hypothetical protein